MRGLIAITGPTGVGKSTLTDGLSETLRVPVCEHVTTRDRRDDDKLGFYKHMANAEFNLRQENQEFLFASGDGKRFYGVTVEEANKKWQDNELIIVNCGYKDIETIYNLYNRGISPFIVVLTFEDYERGIIQRTNDRTWDINIRDERILINKKDYEDHREIIKNCAGSIIYTDKFNKEEVLATCKSYIENNFADILSDEFDGMAI